MSQAEVITSAFNDLLKNLKISGDSLTNISIETTRTKDGDETMKISFSFPLQPSKTDSAVQATRQQAVAPNLPAEDHSAIKKTQSYSCGVCNKKFTKHYNRDIHMRTHSVERPFSCEFCKKTFRRQDHLTDHLTSHINELVSRHYDLQKVMAQKNEKMAHSPQNPDVEILASNPSSEDESPETYPCPFCGRIFSFDCNLEIHMGTHVDERPFSCACKKTFRREDHLRDHLTRHTDDQPFAHKAHQDNSKNNSEKLFSCEICNKQYKHQASLKIHLKSHQSKEAENNAIVSKLSNAAEKPFACPVCERTFLFKDNLDLHMETHNDEYQICMRSFNIIEDKAIQHRLPEEDANEVKNKCYFCEEHFATDAELLTHCLNSH